MLSFPYEDNYYHWVMTVEPSSKTWWGHQPLLTIPAICTEWPNLGKKSIYQSLNCPQLNDIRDTTSAAPCLPTHKQLRSSEYYNLKTIEQIHYMTISVCHLLSFMTSLACKGTFLVRLWEWWGGGVSMTHSHWLNIILYECVCIYTDWIMMVEFKFKVKGIE